MFHNNDSFYGEGLLATPKLKAHPMSAVRDYLFSAFAATLHIWGPFLQPQPEDAPYGDLAPLIMEVLSLVKSLQNANYPNGNLRNSGSAPTTVTGFIIIGLW